VVIGENGALITLRTYVQRSGDRSKIVVEGIVRREGSPGRNFAERKAIYTSGQTSIS